MEKKIIWSRLKNFKCPKCNSDLEASNTGQRLVGCEDEENCGFYVRKERFEKIVENLYQTGKNYKPKFGNDIENLEFLNNFDTENKKELLGDY